MRLFQRKEPPPPARPGEAKGFLPSKPGYILVHYTCGHDVLTPSSQKYPAVCPSREHEGWEEP